MDVTERKRAEEALRQAQADLAHVSRVTTMGELVASMLMKSINHSVRSSPTAVRAYAFFLAIRQIWIGRAKLLAV
jgi:C4-dicarboxylate-specific signal transduction histidine kinase